MITLPGDIMRVYGQYRMRLTPNVKLDERGRVTDDSTGRVAVFDISQKLPLLWSRTFPINEAHAAMTLFEGIGYYPMPIDTK